MPTNGGSVTIANIKLKVAKRRPWDLTYQPLLRFCPWVSRPNRDRREQLEDRVPGSWTEADVDTGPVEKPRFYGIEDLISLKRHAETPPLDLLRIILCRRQPAGDGRYSEILGLEDYGRDVNGYVTVN